MNFATAQAARRGISCQLASGIGFQRVRYRWSLLTACLLLVHFAIPPEHVVLCQEPTRIRLTDYTDRSGIDFTHTDGSSGGRYLVEPVASGMASFDYDLDGRVDVYFVNGAPLKGSKTTDVPTNMLYRNLGGFQFDSVTGPSGLGDASFGLGVVCGDYDNDGFDDVYLSNFGPNALYHNNGDGTFSSVENQPALTRGDKTGGGVCMLDIDADGNLDIYATNYIKFDYQIPPSNFRGRVVYGGPLLYPKETDNLIRNVGNGSFVDISDEAGIGGTPGWGMGTICFDFDQDGDTDIFVANDSMRNFLWQNDGRGKFTDAAVLSGVAYDHRGDPQGSMGVDMADVDGDLLPDLYQTAYTKQFATLYKNVGGGLFEDATQRMGAGVGTFYPVNWGTGFCDFDNDGDKDLFIAHGHIHDNMDDLDDTVSYKIANQVLENRAGRKFVDVTKSAGSGLQIVESSRAIAIDDLDIDGRPDVVILNSRTRANVLKNESETPGNWLFLQLVGTQCNRSAAGTRLIVRANSKAQMLEVHCGRGYQSHFGTRLHFGLGNAVAADSIEVHWHGGAKESFENVKANSLVLIRQGMPLLHMETSR